jgi:hypothetical protein
LIVLIIDDAQNKKVMMAGGIAISGCTLYLGYMYYSGRKVAQNQYIAITEEGNEVVQTKKSRWDM